MFRVFLLFLFSICSLNTAVLAETKAAPKEEEIPLPPELVVSDEATNDRFYQEFSRMLLTLAFIILLIFVLIWMMKKLTNIRIDQSNQASSFQIIEKRAISSKTTLYLLNISDKGVAIAESTNGVTMLTDFPLEADSDEKQT